MGLIDKAANVIHRQHGWFTSDSFTDAPVGSWGTKDGALFERLGHLKSVDRGVPDPVLHTIKRTPRWFSDAGVFVGDWKVTGALPNGIAKVETEIHFDSQFSIVCFLGEHAEVQMENLDEVGDSLVQLYRTPNRDWRPARKWVYTALHVQSGFIVMSRQRNATVRVGGQGTLDASGVPVNVVADLSHSGGASAAELIGLDHVTPFVKLCEVYDPALQRADWRQIG